MERLCERPTMSIQMDAFRSIQKLQGLQLLPRGSKIQTLSIPQKKKYIIN